MQPSKMLTTHTSVHDATGSVAGQHVLSAFVLRRSIDHRDGLQAAFVTPQAKRTKQQRHQHSQPAAKQSRPLSATLITRPHTQSQSQTRSPPPEASSSSSAAATVAAEATAATEVSAQKTSPSTKQRYFASVQHELKQQEPPPRPRFDKATLKLAGRYPGRRHIAPASICFTCIPLQRALLPLRLRSQDQRSDIFCTSSQVGQSFEIIVAQRMLQGSAGSTGATSDYFPIPADEYHHSSVHSTVTEKHAQGRKEHGWAKHTFETARCCDCDKPFDPHYNAVSSVDFTSGVLFGVPLVTPNDLKKYREYCVQINVTLRSHETTQTSTFSTFIKVKIISSLDKRESHMQAVLSQSDAERYHVEHAKYLSSLTEPNIHEPPAAPTRPTPSGQQVLQGAIFINAMRQISRAMIISNRRLDGNGIHVLDAAIRERSVCVVTQFLECDPTIVLDNIDSLRRTPLHMAAMAGHVNILTMLYNHGADPFAEDANFKTPLQYTYDHLKAHPDSLDHQEVARLLEEWTAHADEQAPNHRCETIFRAACVGHMFCMQRFITQFKQPQHQQQQSPEAEERRQKRVAALLNRRNEFDHTALVLSIMFHNHGITRMILNEFADFQFLLAFCNNCTPLHEAAYRGNIEALVMLLAWAQTDEQRKKLLEVRTPHDSDMRSTPLHSAALAGRPLAAFVLTQLGADPCHLDSMNRTPAQVALEWNHYGTFAILESARPRFHQRTFAHLSPEDVFINAITRNDIIVVDDCLQENPKLSSITIEPRSGIQTMVHSPLELAVEHDAFISALIIISYMRDVQHRSALLRAFFAACTRRQTIVVLAIVDHLFSGVCGEPEQVFADNVVFNMKTFALRTKQHTCIYVMTERLNKLHNADHSVSGADVLLQQLPTSMAPFMASQLDACAETMPSSDGLAATPGVSSRIAPLCETFRTVHDWHDRFKHTFLAIRNDTTVKDQPKPTLETALLSGCYDFLSLPPIATDLSSADSQSSGDADASRITALKQTLAIHSSGIGVLTFTRTNLHVGLHLL
eukprot:m.253531 g.253531  ORF g.253531 m.253531 type:complete len:1029 (+) comp15483_c1_seq15:68-3154(+)